MNSAIIVAAGIGSRMKADMSKQYLTLMDKPILAYTIDIFEKSSYIDEIILVIGKKDEELIKALVLEKYKFNKITKIIYGGENRQESVYNGIVALSEKADIVLIHDGVRPILDEFIIEKCIQELKECDALTIGVPAKETIKVLKEDGFVDYTPERKNLWITQTPQAFKVDLIKKAHIYAKENNISATDDAMLVESMKMPVKMIEGSYDNIKITIPDDLVIAQKILEKRGIQYVQSR